MLRALRFSPRSSMEKTGSVLRLPKQSQIDQGFCLFHLFPFQDKDLEASPTNRQQQGIICFQQLGMPSVSLDPGLHLGTFVQRSRQKVLRPRPSPSWIHLQAVRPKSWASADVKRSTSQLRFLGLPLCSAHLCNTSSRDILPVGLWVESPDLCYQLQFIIKGSEQAPKGCTVPMRFE